MSTLSQIEAPSLGAYSRRIDASEMGRFGSSFGSSWRIIVVIVAIVLLSLAGKWLVDQFGVNASSGHGDTVDFMIATALVVYMFAMALPFVPGIEIGLALMLLLGDTGILLVYAATQFALALSFLFGRLVPASTIADAFRWLGLLRAARFVTEIDTASSAERVALLAHSAPAPWLGRLAKHRYLVLAVVLNLPGNAFIGGAGGIGMIAGLSRSFRFLPFAILIAVATTPVPIFLLLSGRN